tara:strand:- start:267 stop:479 length:213 start_codon:yes stop_codon:yes gene_type:complete
MQKEQKLSPLNPGPGLIKTKTNISSMETELSIYYRTIIKNHLKAEHERKKAYNFTFKTKPWADYPVDGWN